MTDQAIAWVGATRSLTPDRPFLMYYSSSTGHPPHTPPKSWLEKGLCHGGFDQGWDVMREQILQRQKEMGIVPPDTKLAANPDYIQAWDSLSDDAKTVYARQMEVYATLGRAPSTRLVGWSTQSRILASWTIRCSSTFPGTTAARRSATSMAFSSSGVR